MELTFRQKNRTLVVFLAGELDHHASSRLRRETEKALEACRGQNIVFCFRKVTFMDSSGIGVLIGRYKQVQSLGGQISVACANEKIGELLTLSGLDPIIPHFSTLEDALFYTEGGEFE